MTIRTIRDGFSYAPPDVNLAPPHGRNPAVCSDGRCECDDCELYHRWLFVALVLTDAAFVRGMLRPGDDRYEDF